MKALEILKRTKEERERYQKALRAATTEEDKKFLLDEFTYNMAFLDTPYANRKSFLEFRRTVKRARIGRA